MSSRPVPELKLRLLKLGLVFLMVSISLYQDVTGDSPVTSCPQLENMLSPTLG